MPWYKLFTIQIYIDSHSELVDIVFKNIQVQLSNECRGVNKLFFQIKSNANQDEIF